MKLKLDGDQHVVVVDGKPVYVHEDGKEIPFDAQEAVSRIKSVSDDRDNLRGKSEAFETKLKTYGDLDVDVALAAIETVKNYDDKNLLDAKDVEKMKAQISETFEKEREQLIGQNKVDIEKLTNEVSSRTETIFNLMVSGEFAKSGFFTGETPRTNMPPEVASEYFGKFFKIEGEGKDAKAVGYLNGEKILSRERFGQAASFDESIAHIIENSSIKDKILISKGGGAGGGGNLGGGLKTVDSTDPDAFGANLEGIASGEVGVK